MTAVFGMKAYKATGSFKVNKFERQDFSIEVAAENEKEVAHKVLSNIGSKHKRDRKQIKIDQITPIEGDQITSPVVRYLVGGRK